MAFHSNNGLFFRRDPDGNVIVEKRVPIIEEDAVQGEFPRFSRMSAVVEHWTLDASTWASVVASVSALGEDLATWQQAERFHKGVFGERRVDG